MATSVNPMAASFRLREVLEKAGISQSAFSRDADLSFATVHRICNNDTAQISLETLDKIMTALEKLGIDVEIEDIIKREAPKRRSRG